MQAACDRQKSYADLKRKPMEFQVGDKVMLKVSPWKRVVHFGKRGKLNPRVHNTFHASNLKKCHADEPLAVPLDGLHVDDKLYFIEEPVEIIVALQFELKQSRIPLVKVAYDRFREVLSVIFELSELKVASDDLRGALFVIYLIFAHSRAEILEADTPPRKRLLLTTPRHGCEVGESFAAAAARQPGSTITLSVDCSFVDTMETKFRDTERRMMTALKMVNMRKDRAAVRAEIEVLRRERLAYEQESIQTREALARSEAYSRALEPRVTVLETQACRHEWQR
nr:putative reverse transcriptase domain-containing protein [Tanacetum cinerariifolium]